ncbi:MAG TPA: PAS domain S-box protein [Deltaproteobacteria bacterium]|nr:PAS domain S-box protein [Deltaproteobacteria bacterium]
MRFGKYYIAVFLAVLAVFLFALSAIYQDAKKKAIDDLIRNQTVHAHQAARGITDHVDHIIATLDLMGHMPDVVKASDAGKRFMEDYYRLHATEIRGITRVDAQGRITYTAPPSPQAIGRDISDQEHVRTVLLTHRAVVSDVFTAVQGFRTIAVHVPVFRNGAFDGTIAFLLPFDTIARRHIENIHIGMSGYAWVISEKGVEISCPVPGHVDRSVFDTCRDFPEILAMAKEMMKRREGVTTYHFNRIRGKEVEQVLKHAVYVPIPLANTFWSIVVATPEDEVVQSLAGLRTRLMVITALLIAFSTIFTYLLVRSQVILGEQKKREAVLEELQESENKYRTLIETTATGFVIVDEQGVVMDANPEYVRLTGHRDLEGILGRSVVEWTAAHEKERNREAVRHCFDQGYIRGFEVEYQGPEGTIIPVEVNATVVGMGGRKRILTLCRDITDRRRIEGDLRRNEETLVKSQSIARIGSYVLDAVHGTWICTTVLEDIFGISPDYPRDIQGWARLIHPEEKDQMLDYLQRHVLQGHNRFEREYRIIRQNDQEERWVSGFGELEFDRQGNTTRMIGTIQDITERKRAEEALRKSESRYRFLAESMNDVIWTTDMNFKVTYNSPSIERILGYTQDERKLQSPMERLTPESLKRASEILKEHLRLEEEGNADPDRTITVELEYYHKNGSTVWMENVVSFTRDERGKITGIHGVARDITERKRSEEEKKRLQEQLAQAQKMEAMGTLAGGIAHDFNNILMAIIGYSQLALDDLSRPERAARELGEVLKAGERAKDLVSQILTFSRKDETAYAPVAIRTVVKESLKMMRSMIPSTIEIRQNLEDSGLIMSNPTKVHQIVMNLCTNAAHAMEEAGGVLEVGLKRVDLDDDRARDLDLRPGPYLRLSVSDTGHGIPPEIAKRIFEPYFTTKVTGRGTGLGLSVVHGIVKSHQGAVVCRSTPGTGSTFEVYLPEIDSAQTQEESPGEPDRQGGTEEILFVDDEPVLAELMEKMLGNLGYRVVTRTGSVEALELFRGDPSRFDLVITDMTMPVMTGDKLAVKLMEIRPDIPVILCSGFSESISEEDARRLGIRQFVMKPLESRNLAAVIRKVLDSREA